MLEPPVATSKVEVVGDGARAKTSEEDEGAGTDVE